MSEPWPNAPLALVAVEARFPLAATTGPLRVPTQRAIRDALWGEDWVLENAAQQTVEMAIVQGKPSPPVVTAEEVTRITVRDRTKVVTVRPNSVTVEVTRYDGYEAFREILRSVFSAVEKLLEPEGISRLGLRYIDEIRVPHLEGPDPWDAWLDRSLLAPRAPGVSTETWGCAVQYATGSDRHLVLRYGPGDGTVINPAGPIKRPRPVPPGPFFALDFDSFWAPSDIPAFATEPLLTACDELRGPERALFDQLIPEHLVKVFKEELPQ